MSETKFDLKAARGRIKALRREARALELEIQEATRLQLQTVAVSLSSARDMESLLASVREFLAEDER